MFKIISIFVAMFLKKYIVQFLLLLILASAANAAPIILYNGNGAETPLMESSGNTWPEPPEYYANWGSLDGMEPPYIRISGQASETRDWLGAFTFKNLPAKVSGGSLQIQARATSNASMSIWLETVENGGSPNTKTYSLTANQTLSLDISLSDFGISAPATISKIHARMNQVPAYQYTTVFFDGIILSNEEAIAETSSSSQSEESFGSDSKTFSEYLISADTVVISDQAKTLGGDIYGDNLEIGADTKIYGSVAANTKCFLRERANISGSLSFPSSCAKQNGIAVGKEVKERTEYSHTAIGSISAGSIDKTVAIGADETLLSGAYGNLRIDARSAVRLQSGSYVFSSIHTEPDVKWHFDLSDGPVKIYVADGIRFADRNVFSATGGNPSEIEWRVANGYVDIGTDGKFFGLFIAPGSRVRLAPRSHLVGSIEARHFQMEPQSTVSMEPRAEEISHSEYNFGPFYDRNLFRYRSALPVSASSVEMYVYADNFVVKVDGGDSRNVSLEKTSQTVSVKISRPFISDFPAEAFSSSYNFTFSKTSGNRIYWNPSSPCASNCHGNSAETALRSFSQALTEAQKEGLEIKMTGGVWEVPSEHSTFPVGLEIVGNENPFWELSSFSDIPSLNVKNNSIDIAGKSPRRLTGLHITGGSKGALKASPEKLELFNMAFTNNASSGDGGTLHYGGKGLVVGKTLLLENSKGNKGGAAFIDGSAEIENLVCSGNSSEGEGGCLFAQEGLSLANAVFSGNKSKKQGGAFYAKSASVLNATVAGNESSGGNAFGGTSGNVGNSIFWNNSGGSIPSSWSATHSSFPSSRSGTGNISGDPKFDDESKPAGSAHFFGRDAGLILAKNSPALKGSDADGVLEQDLLGAEWGNSVAMGAYGDYNSDDNEFMYVRWNYGNLTKIKPGRPIFPNLPNQSIITHAAFGGYGRVIVRLVRKHSKTKISKATVRITVLDSNLKAYPDSKPIDIPFYRYGERDGKYLFSTFIRSTGPGFDPEKHGRMILFSQDPEDQGIHGNVIVIHVKNDTDLFKYEVIEW